MSHEPFSLYHHTVFIGFDYFSAIIHCISKEASMRAKQFCVLTTPESRFSAIKMRLSPPVALAALHSKAVVLLLFS